jgi:hypothetical protein
MHSGTTGFGGGKDKLAELRQGKVRKLLDLRKSADGKAGSMDIGDANVRACQESSMRSSPGIRHNLLYTKCVSFKKALVLGELALTYLTVWCGHP